MASSSRARTRQRRALRRRLRDGLREQGGGRTDVARSADAAEPVRPGIARGEDTADRVRAPDGAQARKARTPSSPYVRLPGLHPLLRVDEGRAVHREAQDAEQAHLL